MAGNASAPSGIEAEKMLGGVAMDVEHRMDMFNTLSHTCFNKCIDKRYKEGELNMGETSCVDRCASKYWQVSNIIGQILASGRHFQHNS